MDKMNLNILWDKNFLDTAPGLTRIITQSHLSSEKHILYL